MAISPASDVPWDAEVDLAPLPAGWRYVPLADIVEAERPITYGIVQPGAETPAGVPIVRVQDIKDGRVDTSSPLRVDPAIAAKYRRTTLRGGELLLTLVGTVGEAAIAPPELKEWNTARAVAVVPVLPEPGAQFVQYVIRTPQLQHLILAWCTTTVQATFNLKEANQLPIPLPPRGEREAIVRILRVLDDKIELNRRMNQTLEGLARALFKSWFVDFDPVVAKAAGKNPVGMSAQTAALFPDRFQDSTLGPIPKGWEPSSVAAIARYVNGCNFTKNATGTGRMVIRIAELNSGPGESTVYNDVKADRENLAAPDDILFAWSGSLDVYRWHGDEALVNQHIFNVISDAFPKWFVFFHLRVAMPFFQGIAADKATTMGHIKREHLAQAELAMPTRAIVAAADRIIRPLYDRIHRQERQNRFLAALRDALLPQLMSGELRVRDAEALAEEALA